MFCIRRTKLLGFAPRTIFASAILVVSLLCQPLMAQGLRSGVPSKPYPANPGLRPITSPSIPTGQIGALQSVVERNRPFQPIQWKLPEGVKIAVAQSGAFRETPDGSNEFALQLGSVYRFKIFGVATYPGQALYPTLEIIGKLNPPEGKLWEFPVEIEVPMRDIALALRGNFVTRVVFVENSENAASVDASDSNENLVFDVPQGIDPVVAAGLRGRALAILRIGSREPDGEPNATDPFFFGLPTVVFRPSNGDVAPAKEDVSPVPEVSVVADEFEVQSSDENEAVVPAAQSVQEMVDELVAPKE